MLRATIQTAATIAALAFFSAGAGAQTTIRMPATPADSSRTALLPKGETWRYNGKQWSIPVDSQQVAKPGKAGVLELKGGKEMPNLYNKSNGEDRDMVVYPRDAAAAR